MHLSIPERIRTSNLRLRRPKLAVSFPAGIDERISWIARGLRKWQRGFHPHLTFQIFQELVPFSKGSVPHLCHARPRYQIHHHFRDVLNPTAQREFSQGRVAPALGVCDPDRFRLDVCNTARENPLILAAKAVKECGQQLTVLTARQGTAMVRELPIAPRTHVLNHSSIRTSCKTIIATHLVPMPIARGQAMVNRVGVPECEDAPPRLQQ